MLVPRWRTVGASDLLICGILRQLIEYWTGVVFTVSHMRLKVSHAVFREGVTASDATQKVERECIHLDSSAKGSYSWQQYWDYK